MRNALSFLIALWACFVSFANAFDGYVDIKNKTGFSIFYIYVSHEDDAVWGEDHLGEEVLLDEDTFRVDVEGYSTSIFDIRAVDSEGNSYTFSDIDIASKDIVVTAKHLDEFEGYVEVTNSTGFDIYYLYVSHEDAEEWEEDVLGDDILEDGESVRVNIEGYSSSIFDIRAEDQDGDTYTFWNIDVATQDVEIQLTDLD